MKKYFYEAQKKQLEKPTEPLYLCCAKAKCWVIAGSEAEAEVLAAEKLHANYDGSGVVLGKPVLTKCVDLPVDWNYGYGDGRMSGSAKDMADLCATNMIR